MDIIILGSVFEIFFMGKSVFVLFLYRIDFMFIILDRIWGIIGRTIFCKRVLFDLFRIVISWFFEIFFFVGKVILMFFRDIFFVDWGRFILGFLIGIGILGRFLGE